MEFEEVVVRNTTYRPAALYCSFLLLCFASQGKKRPVLAPDQEESGNGNVEPTQEQQPNENEGEKEKEKKEIIKTTPGSADGKMAEVSVIMKIPNRQPSLGRRSVRRKTSLYRKISDGSRHKFRSSGNRSENIPGFEGLKDQKSVKMALGMVVFLINFLYSWGKRIPTFSISLSLFLSL